MPKKENFKQKIFVLDTNSILHHPETLKSFDDNIVVICLTVLEELDIFKRDNSELGRNARVAIRLMDKLREEAKQNCQKMANGVKLPNGGELQIFVNHTKEIDLLMLSLGLEKTPDNRIITVASYLAKEKKQQVVFVSKDINARLKADALGIEVQDFEKNKTHLDQSHVKLRTLEINSLMIDDFYQKKEIPNEDEFFPNEFVQIKDNGGSSQSAIGRISPDGKSIRKALLPSRLGELSLRNMDQKNAVELLLDKKVEVVVLIGKAGTGKTLLALQAGLQSWAKNLYEGIIVSRPIIPMGKDIGYLPGTKDEKLNLWMQPIFDNLKFLLSLKNNTSSQNLTKKYSTEKTSFDSIESLIKNEVISLEALTYVRGRSIPRQFVIIDEAQNLTPHEVKTILTRAGENTKMVFTGDPEQIDNPYLDSRSNGLVYLVEKTKISKRVGFINLMKSERSELVKEMSELL